MRRLFLKVTGRVEEAPELTEPWNQPSHSLLGWRSRAGRGRGQKVAKQKLNLQVDWERAPRGTRAFVEGAAAANTAEQQGAWEPLLWLSPLPASDLWPAVDQLHSENRAREHLRPREVILPGRRSRVDTVGGGFGLGMSSGKRPRSRSAESGDRALTSSHRRDGRSSLGNAPPKTGGQPGASGVPAG